MIIPLLFGCGRSDTVGMVDVPRVLLTAVVGSRGRNSHNLNSDWDISIYVQPTGNFLKVGGSYKHSGGQRLGETLDINSWEVGHFMNLCLKGSPSTIEVLLSPKRMYTPQGAELTRMLPQFLERQAVFRSFDGFAKNEREIMLNPNSGRNAKSGSEYLRVLYTGAELLATGRMTLSVPDMPIAAETMAAKRGEMPTQEIIRLGETLRENLRKALQNSVLPEKANPEPLNDFLLRLRRQHW